MFGLKPNKFTEACGWYGMSALIVAYALVSFSVIDAEGVAFQLLNLTGGLGLIIVSASKNVTQSVILNIFWALIGLIALFRVII